MRKVSGIVLVLLLCLLVPATVLRADTIALRALDMADPDDGSTGSDGSHGDEDEDEDEDVDGVVVVAEYFPDDPTVRGDAVISGESLARLTWQADTPAYEGDTAGSLRARYDATMPAGLFGLPVPDGLDEDDSFTVAASFVISSNGFQADPNGFFQLSWGLWNSVTTGLNRTGDLTNFAGDTFDLVEFNWFPNVSPFFGGPFLAPTIFGEANPADPGFAFSGSFVNVSSLFGLQVALPFDTPLLAVIEHRPALDSLALQVYEIRASGDVVPLNAAVGGADLRALSLREYAMDSVGLTLWQDGFSGPTPSVVANLRFHAWVVVRGRFGGRPEDLLHASVD